MTRKEGFQEAFTAAGDAVRFLTLLPFPPPEEGTGKRRVHPWAMAFFPVVGLFLGAIIWTGAQALSLVLPQGLVDLLALATLAVVTGGLHWDALMDTADALGAPRERRSEVLKDVQVGSFGLLALVFVAAAQWVGLFSLTGWIHGAALILFPVWGRCMMVLVTLRMPDLRDGKGLAADFISQLETRHLMWAAGFSFVCTMLLLGLFGALVVVAGLALIGWGLRRLFTAYFEGISGDLIGAAGCLGEAATLLMLGVVA